jgi:hypothetical protein
MGGDCIPDVQNKVEGRTLADILLKVFGSILYLGNLGIGTGRGSGGQFGYRPFGGASRPSIAATPTRPSIPVEGLGPAEILPIDPGAPAIVPLSEGLPETAVIDIPGAGPGLPSENVDVTTVIDELSEVTGVGEHPNIIYSTDEAAQIDIQVQPPPPTRVTIDSSVRNTEVNIQTHASHVDSDFTVFVDAQMHGTNIGENIELQTLNTIEPFEIEEPPVQSTPLSERIISRARDLYNRYTVQLPTRQVLNVTSPRVTFEFENPAFEADVTNAFEREVQELADSNSLEDIIPLSDIRLSELPDRTVRVSRLGQRPGMTTRSGLQIGQRVHFYYDVSPIPTDNIELRTFGEFSNESTLVDELASSSFINIFEQPIQGTLEFPEDTLLDLNDEQFQGGHLVVTATDANGESTDYPILSPAVSVRVFVDDFARDIIVFNPVQHDSNIIIPTSPYSPLTPSFEIDVFGDDYDLHPSLLPRKRKRSYF